jgi:hypothetical protein
MTHCFFAQEAINFQIFLRERKHSCLKPACGMNNVTKCGAKKGETPLLKYSLAHIRESPNTVVAQPLFATGTKFNTSQIRVDKRLFLQKPLKVFATKRFSQRQNYP